MKRDIDYTVIRSGRKTLSIEVKDAKVIVRAPHRVPAYEIDHSKDFYDEVYRVYPEYDRWDRWLKDNGPAR